MAKMTVLEMTQDILNDLDSDAVNSINDTMEATQVAQIIKSTYNNIMDGQDWPHLYTLFQFESLGDLAKPNYLKIPDNITTVLSLKYNTKRVVTDNDNYTDVIYKTPRDFLDILSRRESNSSLIQVVIDTSNIRLNVLNNKSPTYFTSFDDVNLVFDSYNLALETSLSVTKAQGYGKKNTVFTVSDSFIPDLPVQMFSYLLNEAKATAFVVLKQSINAKAEQHSISQRRRMSQQANKLVKGITIPNYGRKRTSR